MRLINGWRFEEETLRLVWFANGVRVTSVPGELVKGTGRICGDTPKGGYPFALVGRIKNAPRRPPVARLRQRKRVRLIPERAPRAEIFSPTGRLLDLVEVIGWFRLPVRLLGARP